MQTKDITEAVELAEKLMATADFVARNYGTYRDGRGDEHYVNGPACRQLREVAQRLRWALSDMQYSPAAPLPAMPEDSGENGEHGVQLDFAVLGQPGWRVGQFVRAK